jgi:hypothetical protein
MIAAVCFAAGVIVGVALSVAGIIAAMRSSPGEDSDRARALAVSGFYNGKRR